MSRELCFLPIGELSSLVRRGEVSPVAVTEEYLERIERLNSKLNAYVRTLKNSSLKAAKTAEKAVKEGKKLGPLHGVPLALKDVFDMKDLPTTHACKVFADNIAKHDGAAVEKLREAGSIFLGKLNLHEIAYGSTSEDSYFGPCRNPWNTEYHTGGSSGGSAAALAASLCAGSLGTDAGGSIRIPSSICGVVGLKPTYGRVSRFGGGVCSWSLDHVGPMTRTVMDAAIMLNVIAGVDRRDPTTLDIPVRDYTNGIEDGIKGLKVGIPRDFFFEEIDHEVKKGVESAIDRMVELGARIEDVNIPHAKYTRSLTLLILMPEIAAFHEPFLMSRSEDYGSIVRARLELGRMIFATDYIKAQRLRTFVIQKFLEAMKNVDILVAPTTPITATKIGQEEVRVGGRLLHPRLITGRLTSAANLLGFPAISVPCGFSSSGMPIGLQIMARPLEEALLLRAAHAYESNTKWHKRRPPI